MGVGNLYGFYRFDRSIRDPSVPVVTIVVIVRQIPIDIAMRSIPFALPLPDRPSHAGHR